MNLMANSERLTDIFGRWPSFHDAEVIRLVLDREGEEGPTLEVKIHVFEATGEKDPEGYYVLKNHTLVTLRFSGLSVLQIEDFNGQNVLSDLEIDTIDSAENEGRLIGVTMPGLYGMGASFECTACEVIDVQPYEAREFEA